MTEIRSRQEYLSALGIKPGGERSPEGALEVALDERARELDFYWKRTSYAWTLNGAVFAGYFAMANSASPKHELLGAVSCLGFVSAAAWWCLNRGSKYWQENWELQVDLLEVDRHGPLHRVNPDTRQYSLLQANRAYPFSVTKVNQHLSLFVAMIWLVLIGDAARHLEWSVRAGSPVFGLTLMLAVSACVSFGLFGRSTPHYSVLGKNVILKYEPVDAGALASSPTEAEAENARQMSIRSVAMANDPFEPTPEELAMAAALITEPPAGQPGTLYSEREFMENLLIQRLNALLVVFAVFVAAAFASKTALLAGFAFLVGSATCFMISRTVRRAHYKHHWIMRLFYRQLKSSPAAAHPIKLINDAMEEPPRKRLAGDSVSRWVGLYIPTVCWASLLAAALAAFAIAKSYGEW